MTATAIITLVITVVAAILSSSVITTLINYRRENPKTKEEAAKIAQEREKVKTEEEDLIIARLEREMTRLAASVDSLRVENAELTSRVHTLELDKDRVDNDNQQLRGALAVLIGWVKHAYNALSADQARIIGQPPDYAHLIN